MNRKIHRHSKRLDVGTNRSSVVLNHHCVCLQKIMRPRNRTRWPVSPFRRRITILSGVRGEYWGDVKCRILLPLRLTRNRPTATTINRSAKDPCDTKPIRVANGKLDKGQVIGKPEMEIQRRISGEHPCDGIIDMKVPEEDSMECSQD